MSFANSGAECLYKIGTVPYAACDKSVPTYRKLNGQTVIEEDDQTLAGGDVAG